MVGGHIATKANEADLKEHKSDVQEQWDVIAKEVRLLLRTTASATLHVTSLCPVTEPYFAVSGSSQSSFQSPRCRKHTRVVWRKL